MEIKYFAEGSRLDNLCKSTIEASSGPVGRSVTMYFISSNKVKCWLDILDGDSLNLVRFDNDVNIIKLPFLT